MWNEHWGNMPERKTNIIRIRSKFNVTMNVEVEESAVFVLPRWSVEKVDQARIPSYQYQYRQYAIFSYYFLVTEIVFGDVPKMGCYFTWRLYSINSCLAYLDRTRVSASDWAKLGRNERRSLAEPRETLGLRILRPCAGSFRTKWRWVSQPPEFRSNIKYG